MKNDMMDKQHGGLSKLAQLRQNRGLKPSKVDVEKAIDGFASSINTEKMLEEIKRSSALVNLIIDCSGSMDGTSSIIATEINDFAVRQSNKIYKTLLSLTLFDHEVYPRFSNVDVKIFTPIQPWACPGGTNIYDAIFTAVDPVKKESANYRLHLLITDGDNGYSIHSQEEVQELISKKMADGDFIFLLYNDEYGYELDIEKMYARELGINPNNAVSFNRHGDGIKILFKTIEKVLDGLRTTGTVSEDWAKAITAHASNPSLKANEMKFLE